MRTVLVVVAFVMLAVVTGWTVAHAGENTPPRYRLAGGTNAAVKQIIVLGEGCMNAEDSLELRLVEYRDGAWGKTAVYRCVRP